MIPLPALGLKDWIIAGLATLCLLLTLNTYLDFHIGPVGFEGWKPKAERFEAEAKACEVRHSVTRGSLEKLITHNAKLVADGKAREERQQEALQEQEERSAALDSQIDRIRAQRPPASPVRQECKSPASVLEAEGL